MPNQVVVWKPRANPTNRILPEYLKLAILSRGHIGLLAKNVAWFLEVAKSNGADWPDQLTAGLGMVAPGFITTFELFLNQRPKMSIEEIGECLVAYLAQRRRKELQPDCYRLLHVWLPAGDRRQMEVRLGVELSNLFRRPQVRLPPRDSDPYRYILLGYICLPRSINRFLKPKPVPTLPPLPSQMPPLEALTKTSAEINVRTGPGEENASLGVEAGIATRAQVLDKALKLNSEKKEVVWYQIRLLDPMRVVPALGDAITKAVFLPAGTVCWISEGGLDPVIAPWALFRHDLVQFEQEQQSLSLGARITALRQQLHERRFNFDAIIGAEPGRLYREDLPYVAGKWQLPKDYRAVRAPDNRLVDIQHLMVGLEVLSHSEERSQFANTPIGTNWSASTWAGDLGSAAADATIHYDEAWEKWNRQVSEPERLEYYFSTRAPDRELLGDIDAWGLRLLRNRRPDVTTLDGLLALYYEETTSGGGACTHRFARDFSQSIC